MPTSFPRGFMSSLGAVDVEIPGELGVDDDDDIPDVHHRCETLEPDFPGCHFEHPVTVSYLPDMAGRCCCRAVQPALAVPTIASRSVALPITPAGDVCHQFCATGGAYFTAKNYVKNNMHGSRLEHGCCDDHGFQKFVAKKTRKVPGVVGTKDNPNEVLFYEFGK